MKNLQKVLMVLCIMGLMISCGGSGSGGGNTPESVAEKYVETLYKGDLDALKKFMCKEEQENMNNAKAEELEMAKYFMAAIKEKGKGASGFKAIETNLSEDGNSATVKVEVNKGEKTDTEKVKLINEDGKWVVKEMSLK